PEEPKLNQNFFSPRGGGTAFFSVSLEEGLCCSTNGLSARPKQITTHLRTFIYLFHTYFMVVYCPDKRKKMYLSIFAVLEKNERFFPNNQHVFRKNSLTKTCYFLGLRSPVTIKITDSPT